MWWWRCYVDQGQVMREHTAVMIATSSCAITALARAEPAAQSTARTIDAAIRASTTAKAVKLIFPAAVIPAIFVVVCDGQ